MGSYVFAEIQVKVGDKWEPTHNEIGPIKSSQVGHLLGNHQSVYLEKDTIPVFNQHRGSPEDLFSSDWDWDYEYNRNWITGKEFLEAINSDRKVIGQGYISKGAFLKWDGVSEPDVVSASASGKTVTAAIANTGVEFDSVLVTWEYSVKSALGIFALQILEEIQPGKMYRIVYGFDQ